MNIKLEIVALALASVVACPLVFAQGEVGAVPKAEPFVKRTPELKAAGKSQRRSEGRVGAREDAMGEVGKIDPAAPAVHRTSTEKAEIRVARANKRAMTARANKAGEIKSPGEVGPTP